MSDDQTLFEPLLKPGTEISSSVRFFFLIIHTKKFLLNTPSLRLPRLLSFGETISTPITA